MTAPVNFQGSASDDESLPQKKSRKRVTADQAVVLQHAFQDNPHPAREARTRLASELGMELRAVNHWFQNKRQAVKRRGKTQSAKLEQSEAAPNPVAAPPPTTQRLLRAEATWPGTQHAGSSRAGSSKATTTRPVRQTVSMNDFLDMPSRPIERRNSLWDYMLSSPPQPPSPRESTSRARPTPSMSRHPPVTKHRSLEWACANSQLVESDVETDIVELDGDTDVEDGEGSEAPTDVNTSDGRRSATNISPTTGVGEAMGMGTAAKDDRQSHQLPAEEMEAAMVLLDFMRR